MKAVKLLGYLFAFRIANALLCTTFFQPDEFFQSLEVAHRLVFGYGWQTWEWRPETAIRSPLHALIFVPGYWLVKAFKLEQTYALVSSSYGCLIRSPCCIGPDRPDFLDILDRGPEDLARRDSRIERLLYSEASLQTIPE